LSRFNLSLYQTRTSTLLPPAQAAPTPTTDVRSMICEFAEGAAVRGKLMLESRDKARAGRRGHDAANAPE
jgi:hypothetical protein